MELIRINYGGRLFLAAMIAVALLVAWAVAATLPASADDATQMSIAASGPSADCDGDTCTVDPGDPFTLTVSADVIPEGGYILVQSVIDYGSLLYTPPEDTTEEILWPDADPAVCVWWEFSEESVHHGCLTGVAPPLPMSEYVGPVFQIQVTCTDDFTSHDVQLLPCGDGLAGESGAFFATEVAVGVTPKVNALTINCGDAPPTPTPGPDDDDDAEPDPTALPGVGSAPLAGSDSSTNNSLLLLISALLVAGAAGVGASLRRFTAGQRNQ